jgi:hypothetical protein
VWRFAPSCYRRAFATEFGTFCPFLALVERGDGWLGTCQVPHFSEAVRFIVIPIGVDGRTFAFGGSCCVWFGLVGDRDADAAPSTRQPTLLPGWVETGEQIISQAHHKTYHIWAGYSPAQNRSFCDSCCDCPLW